MISGAPSARLNVTVCGERISSVAVFPVRAAGGRCLQSDERASIFRSMRALDLHQTGVKHFDAVLFWPISDHVNDASTCVISLPTCTCM